MLSEMAYSSKTKLYTVVGFVGTYTTMFYCMSDEDKSVAGVQFSNVHGHW